MFSLTKQEYAVFKKLNTPTKIQNFLDTFPINWEKNGETYMSPRRALRVKKMHCLEGALVAAAALWIHGQEPLLMDLKTVGDDDHVVALYRVHGYWGAISKTNHTTLRWRDPIFKNVRELALSYFHEYFVNKTRRKVLKSYSRPLNLKKFGDSWITDPKDLFYIAETIDAIKHFSIVPKKNAKYIRMADSMEWKAGKIIEWKKLDART